MKQLILNSALALTIMSNVTLAHSGDQCNFSFDHDLKFTNNEITISQSGADSIYIDNNNQLYINNQPKTLTAEQQQWIDGYADNIRILIPEITGIAAEGINLGVEAASLALGTLLGESDPDFLEFQHKLQSFGDEILAQIDSNNFDSKTLEATFENDFEQKIESFVEETVEQLTPRLMAKVLTAAMSGGNAENEIEMRAEQVEYQVTHYIEPRAEALEARAEDLCQIITEMDTIETQLVNSGIKEMDLIRTDSEGNLKVHNLHMDGITNLKKSKIDLSL